ncbi:MAG: hypothetical protein WCV72_02525 [Patescibacteria group bacterium]
MQKLKSKNRLGAILLALFIFCAASGAVFAADEKKFEVTLQTPFSPPPTEPCTQSPDDQYTTTTQSGETIKWVCRKGSILWQQVIEGDDGNEILTNYIALVYKFLAGTIGFVAVLMIVFGGIEISTAGANQAGLQSGKDRILAALVGLTLLFLSSLILYTINPTFFT